MLQKLATFQMRDSANRSRLRTQCYIDNRFWSELNYPEWFCFGAFTSKRAERTPAYQWLRVGLLPPFGVYRVTQQPAAIRDAATSGIALTTMQSSQGRVPAEVQTHQTGI